MWYYRLSGMNLMYVHDDTETLEDSFTILLTDGKHQVQRRLMVQIVPQNDEGPSVIRWGFSVEVMLAHVELSFNWTR